MTLAIVLAAWPSWAAPVVLIDPGHGGADPGVRLSGSVQEKDVSLAIALMVQKDLQQNGRVVVQLTRVDDKQVSTAERVAIVQRLRPQMLISLHVNAGFGKKSSGYELYFPGFASQTAAKEGSDAVVRDMKKNAYLNDSVRFAQIVQRQLDRVFPRKGRGLREAPALLLEGLTTPAVVVEFGFATHPDDKKKLMDPAIQKAIAQSLSAGIAEYFR